MSADALIAVADAILAKADNLSTTEISKKGRKYKFINDTFQRIREEDKHLVINPDNVEERLSAVLAYSILSSIDESLFKEFPDVCWTIIGTAEKLEQNRWYEEENSSVIPYKQLKTTFSAETKTQALECADAVEPQHLEMGSIILYCAKLDFLHTDHHIGTRLDGVFMRHYVEDFFGEEAAESQSVLLALKSFVHWANIKGLLWKLEVPNLSIDEDLKSRFESFPDPPEQLKDHVYARFPSGTSKYSLIVRSLDVLEAFNYAKVIPYPTGNNFNLNWLYSLSQKIEQDPISYHLRAKTKKLSDNPVNLGELSKTYSVNIQSLLALISLVVNTFSDTGGEYLLQNSKLPEFSELLISEYSDYHNSLVEVKRKIEEYEQKGWSHEDIVLRLYNSNVANIHDEVAKARQIYY